jgi:ABC-type Fe3+ transport system substrate-binding protein
LEQKPVLSRDERQISEWLARGVHPVVLDVPEQVERLQNEGFPVVNILTLPDAPGSVSAGGGMVAIVAEPAHPAAAKVFVNWIASREGLETYSRGFRNSTTRADVDESFVRAAGPKPELNYVDTNGWDFADLEEKVRLQVKKLLQR